MLGGLVATSGVLAGLLGREQDGRGRRVRSSLLCAAALLQAQLGERGPHGRPELGAFEVPLPAVGGDLVLSRTATPRAATLIHTGSLRPRPPAVDVCGINPPTQRWCGRIS
ncbi:MAG: hypothetical protein ACRDRQ_04835 [Pseudonocardiaceae bacterium]